MEQPSRTKIDDRISRKLDVGIVCENEILRYGLKVTLHDIMTVRTVREIAKQSAYPGGNGLGSLDIVIISYAEWATAMRVVPAARAANIRVLAFVDDVSAKDPEKLVSLRPDGFILQRDLTKRRLEDALIRVSRSETPMPTEIVSQVFDSAIRILKTSHPRFVELTPREQDALELLADGLSNKEIAQRLSVSLHGAKRLVGNILLKLNCPNRTQAVVLAMRHGLLRDRN